MQRKLIQQHYFDMKKSQILLITGLIVLLVGAVLTFTPLKEYANYVLVAGLFIIIIRGSMKAREDLADKDKQNDENKEK